MSKKYLSIVITYFAVVVFLSFVLACSGTEGDSSSVSTKEETNDN